MHCTDTRLHFQVETFEPVDFPPTAPVTAGQAFSVSFRSTITSRCRGAAPPLVVVFVRCASVSVYMNMNITLLMQMLVNVCMIRFGACIQPDHLHQPADCI